MVDTNRYMVFRSHGKALSSILPTFHADFISNESSSACSGAKVSTCSNLPTYRQTTKNFLYMCLYNKRDTLDLSR